MPVKTRRLPGPRQSTIEARTRALLKLRSAAKAGKRGGLTQAQLGLTESQKQHMLTEEYMKVARERVGRSTRVAVERTGEVGRPAIKYVMTDKGRSRADSLARKRGQK